jgi:uncharacterized protein (TIGR03435 family)
MRRTSLAIAATVIFVMTFCIGAAVAASPQAADRFEVASIKPSGPAPVGGRGGGGPSPNPCVATPLVAPGRFAVSRVTLVRLFTWAYGIRECRSEIGIYSGVQEWMKSDRFDVEATIPAGSPVYGRLAFTNADAPQLQLMLQNLLADRFKLVVRREMKDLLVYNLVVAKPGKMKPSENQGPPADPFGERNGIALGPGGAPPPGVMLLGNGVLQGTSIPMSALTQSFQGQVDRPVIDKTGLKGLFDIHVPVEFELPTPGQPPVPPNTNPQVLEALGLKLESGRGQVEVFVIERAEKPSVN